MHCSLFFVCFLTLQSFVFAELSRDRFGLHADRSDKKIDRKLNAKVDLPKRKDGLPAGKGGLAKGQTDLTGDKVGSSVDKVLKPSNFTYCFMTSRNVFHNSERSDFDEREESKVSFAIEFADDGRRFYLRSYKEQLGKWLSSKNLLASCKRCKPKVCVTWEGIQKEFHLYVEGKHLLGGIGKLEWGLLGKIKATISKGKKAVESLTGPMAKLQRWDRAISQEEAEAFGSLQGDPVEGKSSNWKINAVEITEPYIPSCPHPTTFKYDNKTVTGPEPSNGRDMIEFPRPRTKKLEEFSLCLWVYFEFRSSTSLSMLDYLTDDRAWILNIRVQPNETLYNWKRDEQAITAPALQPEKWHHLCFTWSEIRNGAVDIYSDGKLALHTQVKKGSSHIAGEVHFAYVKYKNFNPNNPADGYELKAIGIDMWDYALSPYEVRQSYECEAQKPGNHLSWATSEQTYNGTVW